jgi:hypothetical protein
MFLEKPDDPGRRVDEGCGEERKRDLADDHQQPDGVTPDGGELVGFVAYPAIVRQRDPTLLADLREPHLIGTVRREVIPMSFNTQARFPQNPGKPDAEVSIGKEDNAQAARS